MMTVDTYKSEVKHDQSSMRPTVWSRICAVLYVFTVPALLMGSASCPYSKDKGLCAAELNRLAKVSADFVCYNGREVQFDFQSFFAVSEMDVQGNGVSITDGDTSPSTDDDTDFGAVLTTGSKTFTYTIENTGGTDLILDGAPLVMISGAHAADFTVTASPSTPIGAGLTTTFDIQFAPSATGLRTASVSDRKQ